MTGETRSTGGCGGSPGVRPDTVFIWLLGGYHLLGWRVAGALLGSRPGPASTTIRLAGERA